MAASQTALLLALPLSLALAAAAQPPGPPPIPEGSVVHRDLAYVPRGHARQKLDLYLPPEGDRLPLILWIHGGAFLMGSKEDGVPLDYLRRGYAVASANYRLSQHALFPAQIQDCKAAVRRLRAKARKCRLHPDRFAASGSSAGGHLVAMLGTTGHTKEFDVGPNLGVSSRVQAMVDCFGPTDFLQMDAHRLPEGQVHAAPNSPESVLIDGPTQANPAKTRRANPARCVTRTPRPS